MLSLDIYKEKFSPVRNFVSYKRFMKQHRKEHPEEFPFFGMSLYVGEQGAGKTIKLVNGVDKLMRNFPKAILVTNLEFKDYPFDNKRVFYFKDQDDLFIDNGEYGVIIALDEVQTYFGNLKKGNISEDVFALLCQERKAHKLILMTSQKFNRVAKIIREQSDFICYCTNTFFSWLKKCQIIKGSDIMANDTSGEDLQCKVYKTIYYILNPKMFNSYDTSYIVKTLDFDYGENTASRKVVNA